MICLPGYRHAHSYVCSNFRFVRFFQRQCLHLYKNPTFEIALKENRRMHTTYSHVSLCTKFTPFIIVAVFLVKLLYMNQSKRFFVLCVTDVKTLRKNIYLQCIRFLIVKSKWNYYIDGIHGKLDTVEVNFQRYVFTAGTSFSWIAEGKVFCSHVYKYMH